MGDGCWGGSDSILIIVVFIFMVRDGGVVFVGRVGMSSLEVEFRDE